MGSVGVTPAATTRAGRNSSPGIMAYMRAAETIQPRNMLRFEGRERKAHVSLAANAEGPGSAIESVHGTEEHAQRLPVSYHVGSASWKVRW